MARKALSPGHPVYEQITLECLEGEYRIGFGPLFDTHAAVLSVTAELSGLDQDTVITVWSGSRDGKHPAGEPVLWARIAEWSEEVREDQIQQVRPDRELLGLDLAEDEDPEEAAFVVSHLTRLLMLASPGHEGLTGAARIRSYIQLNAACQDAWREVETQDSGLLDFESGETRAGHHPRPWHSMVDDFTSQCRLGWLLHLQVEQSSYGPVDISAAVSPPGLDHSVPVRVFMHQGELEDRPGHWYAAGDVMCPAHGEDVDVVGLAAAFPVASQGFIVHALEHLHSISHLVEDMLQSRWEETVDALAVLAEPGDDLPEMVKWLGGEAIVDTMVGLNGIARLHTGSADVPDPEPGS